MQTVKITRDDNKQRLDVFLHKFVHQDISKGQVQKLIQNGKVLLNDQIVLKPSHKLKTGDTLVSNYVAEEEKMIEESTSVEPEDIPLQILYEDDDVLVVNKPTGMIVHPSGTRNRSGTLVNALLHHCGADKLSTIGIEPDHYRPGIVHRLDKNTTGVMVIAKNNEAHTALKEQFANKISEESQLKRLYITLVHNHVKRPTQVIDVYLGRHKTIPQKRIVINERQAVAEESGKRAITTCKVLETLTCGKEKFTLVELKLGTGRTHQIRVSLAHIDHPIIGDVLYNPALKKKNTKKSTTVLAQYQEQFQEDEQLLHAKLLGFLHPRTKQYVQFEAPIPPLFEEVLQTLRTPPK